MIIRQERPEDYDTVYHVVKEAFENVEYTDGNEQNLVAALRKSKSFIPELSLVAVEDEKIVGHILFTKAVVQGVEVLALAPLSVLPDYQNRGIGLSLMKEGHSIAHKLGYEYSVVLGHSKYYPKAGYIPASECGIKAPFEVDDESFMALNLNGSQNIDPVFTAYGTQDWHYNEKGEILHFPVDNYYYEGKRTAVFLGEKVTKFHRTLTTYLNTLLSNGFIINHIVEPQPPENMMDIPGMQDEMRRPMMLIVSANKKVDR